MVATEVHIGNELVESVTNLEGLLEVARRFAPRGAVLRRVHVDGVCYEDLDLLSTLDWDAAQDVRVEYVGENELLAEVQASVAGYATRLLDALPGIVMRLRMGSPVAETGFLQVLDGLQWLLDAHVLSDTARAGFAGCGTVQSDVPRADVVPAGGETLAGFLEPLRDAVERGDRDDLADLLENDLADWLMERGNLR